MDNLGYVQDLIQKSLPNSIVQVGDMTGTQDHLQILVVDDIFEGKLLIDQHRIIMDILKADLDSNNVHAIKIKTLTHKKYQELKND